MQYLISCTLSILPSFTKPLPVRQFSMVVLEINAFFEAITHWFFKSLVGFVIIVSNKLLLLSLMDLIRNFVAKILNAVQKMDTAQQNYNHNNTAGKLNCSRIGPIFHDLLFLLYFLKSSSCNQEYLYQAMTMQWHNFQDVVSLAPLGKKCAPKIGALNCSRTSLQRSTRDSKISVKIS